jgi:flagellar biosynthetic protein FliR
LCRACNLAIGTIPFCIGLAGEIVIGFIIGISVQLIFAGIQLGGQVIGFQMGLSVANVLDPLTNSQVSVTARFNDIMAMLIFLAVNAHYMFLRVIAESFQILPPLAFQFTRSLMDRLIVLAGNMFVIAIKVAAPVMGVLLLTSIALGLIARTVPQLNVFIVAMPLKIIIGLVIMGVSASLVASFFISEFNAMGHIILILLRAAGAKSP